MTLLFCLFSFIAGGIAYQKAQKLVRPQVHNAETFAALLEKAAHKFLVHANHAHIGEGNNYMGDLRDAEKLMAKAQHIRQLEEEGKSFLQLTSMGSSY